MNAGGHRRRTLAAARAAAAGLSLAACAGVEVSSDPGGRRPEGLLVYPARAALLPVAIEADGTVSASRVAWIPDLSRPVRVERHDGLGRAGVALSLVEGQSYAGYLVRLETKETDGRVPELLRAAGAAAAGAIAGIAVLGAAGR